MQELNNLRSAPPINTLTGVKFPDIDHKLIDGDIDAYILYAKEPEIFQLDLVFSAGKWYEKKQLVASATSVLIKEGTEDLSALEIAKIFEDQGAVFRSIPTNDHIIVSLYCLRKTAEPLVASLFKLLCEANFPESEIELFNQRSIEGLKVDLANNDIVAYRSLTSALFGEQHPYGYNRTEIHYDNLLRSDLIDHFSSLPENIESIFMSGQVDQTIVDSVISQVSGFRKMPQFSNNGHIHPIISSKQKFEIKRNRKGPQTSIRMGKILGETDDLEIKSLRVIINTILGGFFGSRLMTSIREEKGYTYGINSYIDRHRHGSYLGINTEVGNEYVDDTIKEIHLQMQRLQDNLVPEEELNMVKNYIKGNLLGNYNGTSKSMQSLRRYLLKGERFEHINYFVDYINSVCAEDIRSGALNLLDVQDLHTILVD